MSDGLDKLDLSPELEEEVREILLALLPFFREAGQAGDRTLENFYPRMPPELRVKADRLNEILEESNAPIGPLLKIMLEDPE